MRKNLRAIAFSIFSTGLVGVALLGLLGSPAQADSTYQPATWNGYKIYLSKACHDGNDGVPGGACIPNHGCKDYNENSESSTMATTTAAGIGTGSNLVERGYRARKGDGTLSQNIANSNAWGANMHIPLHSNAKSEACSNKTLSGHGSWGLYYNANDKKCATHLVGQVGQVSPGTNDVTVYRDNLGELKTNAVSCYLEAEFHTWNKGVTWLLDEVNWTWRIGQTVDLYYDWP